MVQAENARVVDAEMNDVPPADGQTMGEIVLRGNNVMLGYYRDEAATAEAFAGGWFHSGDLGVMHPDGYIQLKDRAKDIIISGGENISTVEVEQAIMSHPRGDRRGSRRRSGREVGGRAPEGIRGAGQGITGIRRRHRRAHPHFAGRVQGSPATSSSRSTFLAPPTGKVLKFQLRADN